MPHYFIFLIVLAVIALTFFTVTYICYKIAFGYSKKKDIPPLTLMNGEQYDNLHPQMTKLINDALKIPFEEVRIKSFDGLNLYGRFYKTSNSAPVQIMFHGYRSNALRDFSGGLNFYLDLGFNVLLVDQRAHGRSKAKTITFGVLERYDCKSWVNYAVDRFGEDTKILITGISMGAATVLMASDLDLPKNVKGILADCGYTSPEEIIKKTIKDMKLPLQPTMFFIRTGGVIYGGFDIKKSSALKSLENTDIPVLFIHGEADKTVPVEMSVKNYNACRSKCDILTVKNAAHGVSYLRDFEAYSKTVKKFFKQIAILKCE